MTHSTDQIPLQNIVEEAPKGCKLCKNFGTQACPEFQQIQQETGANREELSAAITDYQEQAGQPLQPCENDTDPKIG